MNKAANQAWDWVRSQEEIPNQVAATILDALFCYRCVHKVACDTYCDHGESYEEKE